MPAFEHLGALKRRPRHKTLDQTATSGETHARVRTTWGISVKIVDNMQNTHGFIFATTGAQYTTLARRAARNLRLAMPNAQIDLFTDQSVDDETFNVIHKISHGFFRPKMEALRRSRFARTIYLDADVIVLADVSELFASVEDVDLAGCQGWIRIPSMMYLSEIPRSFPMLNSGVLVVRRSDASDRLLAAWEDDVRSTGAKVDQGCLRNSLYRQKVQFQVLPLEYNLINLRMLDIWENRSGAPRILHVTKLHKMREGPATTPFNLESLLSKKQINVLRGAVAADRLIVPQVTLPPGKNPGAKEPIVATKLLRAKLVRTIRSVLPDWVVRSVKKILRRPIR